jgi:hypothetical protein
MNIKEALNSKPKNLYGSTNKTSLPKEKVEGFYQAIQNTNMLEVVEAMKKERITKP